MGAGAALDGNGSVGAAAGALLTPGGGDLVKQLSGLLAAALQGVQR